VSTPPASTTAQAIEARGLSKSFGERPALREISFDAAAGEVLFAPRLQQVRQQPSHEFRVTLLSVEDGRAAAREIGHYTFRHQGVA
jgi:hypothetical protein